MRFLSACAAPSFSRADTQLLNTEAQSAQGGVAATKRFVDADQKSFRLRLCASPCTLCLRVEEGVAKA